MECVVLCRTPGRKKTEKTDNFLKFSIKIYLSLVMRKPVFGVCDQVRPKLACSTAETS